MKNIRLFFKLIIILFTVISPACKDFVTIVPPLDQTVTQKVYQSDETASAALRGLYSKMISGSFADGNFGSVTFLAGRSADDFTNYSANVELKQFSLNNILPENQVLRAGLWQSMYQCIYASNAVLENLEISDAVSSTLKKQLMGEAKFVRAFCHFYLTNLFGKIPLILSTDYRINKIASANSQVEIYAQIINDLKDAKSQLTLEYPSNERARVNKWAAAALLARIYLYDKQWDSAEKESTEVISQTNLYELLTEINNVFLKNSREAIFQLALPAALGGNTREGAKFILTSAPSTENEVILNDQLIGAFELGDERLAKWTGSFTSSTTKWYFPFKYKIKSSTAISEYTIVLRLAEQYLIRAESRINLDRIAKGIEDLNAIRQRSRAIPTVLIPEPLPMLSSTLTKEEALYAVERERRIELFSEWGHRWFDLKRTDRADAVLKLLKAPNWQKTDIFYPIPQSDLLNDLNLKQNEGYR